MIAGVATYYIEGEPKGQPRPRAFAMKTKTGGYSARVFDAGTAEGWKSSVATATQQQPFQKPLAGPLTVALNFYMRRPKGHYGTGKNATKLKPSAPTHFVKKPDCDNLAKAVLDALTQLGVWKDDDQVVSLQISKHWWSPDTYPSPGCEVFIGRFIDEKNVV
jgi:Holliday junction resolvase RusA-like endonuclease